MNNGNNGNDNKSNGNNKCPMPSANELINGKSHMILQPLKQSKYIRLNYAGSNDGVIGIGDPQAVLQFLAGLGLLPTKLPNSDLDQNRLKLLNNSLDLSKLICGIRIQVSASWVGLFAVNPFYFGANEDGVERPEPINLADYITEYSYRDLVLTVPVKFLLDTKHAFLWDLTEMAGEPVEGSLSITMYIQKEFNRIYHIQ